MTDSDFSDEVIALTVLRTSDASKTEIELSLNKTLNDLKDAISSSSLGPLAPAYQRLFHLGRELKSGNRSLGKLGLGRFLNYTLHLHSTQPQAYELSSEEEEEEDEVVEVEGPRKRSNTIIDLIDSDDECLQGKRRRVS